jgi:hypothetical protein
MSIDVMKQALEALERAASHLRTAIAEAEKQEPVAWPCHMIEADFSERTVTLGMECGDYKVSAGKHWLSTTPPQRQPLIDSLRQMRDVQGTDGTWNCDPYMHGLYNGLEFAVSLLEQREPQFKDAPEKWLCDLPKPRIFSSAHGIGGGE